MSNENQQTSAAAIREAKVKCGKAVAAAIAEFNKETGLYICELQAEFIDVSDVSRRSAPELSGLHIKFDI